MRRALVREGRAAPKRDPCFGRTLLDERHRGAIHVAAERTPGVKAVEDHLVWVDPVSGMVMPTFEEVTTPQGKIP
jgi:hypothetical protein